MDYFAKSFPQQTLEEHTKLALSVYHYIRNKYPNLLSEKDWMILKTAILYHDFGKMDPKFQNVIRKRLNLPLLNDANDYESFNHNYLSPAFIHPDDYESAYGDDGFDILVKAIYFHHNRRELSRHDKRDMESYIKEVLSKDEYFVQMEEAIRITSLSLNYITYVDNFETFEDYETPESEILNRYILIKGLLNRIDYAASAGVEQIEEDTFDADNKSIADKTKESILCAGYSYRSVQSFMMSHQNENLVVIASTGAGKTEAALLWLGNQKAFYTLPLKVALNDIYKRIKHKIGYTNTALLHSDAFSIYVSEFEEEQVLEQYSLSRLLAKPFTLCTIDQLFKFTYKYNGGEMQLAALACSKLVIDEIQMYSPHLVGVLIYGLKKITELGGKFAIMTATFPYFLYELMERERIPIEESCKNQYFYSPITLRHRIHLLEEKTFNIQTIIDYGTRKKVLVICNTVGKAQNIYDTIKSAYQNANIFHSAYLRKDKAILEDRILSFARNTSERNQEPGIWITTQVVEASLDIDFDILFTEMTSIDSLLQRMGRIYRNRLYDMVDEPNVYILNNYNTGGGRIVDRELYEFSLRAVTKFQNQLLEESDHQDLKQEMIQLVYHQKHNPDILKSNYYRSIRDTIDWLRNLTMYDMTKSSIDRVFRDIDSITVIPYSVYNMLVQEHYIEQWQKILNSKDSSFEDKRIIKNEIMDYTVNLSNYRNLDIDMQNQLIYGGSRIYLYRGEYEFEDNTGKGIIKKYMSSGKQEFDIFL